MLTCDLFAIADLLTDNLFSNLSCTRILTSNLLAFFCFTGSNTVICNVSLFNVQLSVDYELRLIFCIHTDTQVNIAITGRTGTGKSSFINAIMKKWSGTRPAKVGPTETTKTCVGYVHPNDPNIILWDLPGVGTENFPQTSYLEKVNADLFDVFIIMTADRFTEQDTWLGKVMQERNKPVIFVRTKIGIDVENSKHDYPEKDERVVLKEMKADMMSNCAKFLQNLGVFLIDSHKSDMYEFSDLEKFVLQDTVSLRRPSVGFLY